MHLSRMNILITVFYENNLGNLSLVKGYETEWIYLLAPYPAEYSFLIKN